MKVYILFRSYRYNRYSINALVAGLEYHNAPFNGICEFDSPAGIAQMVAKLSGKKIIAYSFMSPQWREVSKEWHLLQRILKKHDCVLVAGGPHPSGAVKKVLQEGADFVCAGTGEGALSYFVKHLCDDGTLPKNFFFLENDKVKSGIESVADDWEFIPPFSKLYGRFGPIEITRGCPFRCSYCETPVLKGTKVRHKALDVLFDSIRLMVQKGKTDVRFISPNALSYGSPDGRIVNMDALYSLLEGVKRILPPEGRIFFGSFPSEVRPEFVNASTVQLMKEFCSNSQVVVGAQSGSERMLKKMRRGHSVDDVVKACEELVSAGFKPSVDFIFGLPYESDEDMMASLRLIEKLVSMGARIHAHAFLPLPGSRWGGRKPTSIPSFVRRRLESLIASGKLFGQWMHQERIGMELAEREGVGR
ncbi:MAG: TIGR04013 family B12-binding domain/radical SAM domain-containing protein [Deltaproteobacteria bacterium]|nr:TIGR04013 family B12-binding domain/radical SAM domain-containing protein [Deltaproteobacteria bacterium]MBW2068466.1 TIGR04013 family B12-binding domain/radical SAM domain-containing protein [Deltaproteobacteria bacterium]